jgi:hypothetical protein
VRLEADLTAKFERWTRPGGSSLKLESNGIAQFRHADCHTILELRNVAVFLNCFDRGVMEDFTLLHSVHGAASLIGLDSGLLVRRESLLLERHTKNATTDILPIQCAQRSALNALEKMHVTEASTSPCHNVRGQTDRSHGTVIGEHPVQTRLRSIGRQILHYQLRNGIIHIFRFMAKPE